MTTKKRLSKALAAAGIASRRACETIITQGRVKVNGAVALLPQFLVDWDTDRITIDGEKISGEENKVYYLLNKPSGTICSNRVNQNNKRVIDLFDESPHRLFTVGRLDKETTGLIIVTNDGHYAQRVIHPSSKIQKEYLAKTDIEISHEHLVQLSKGGFIEGSFVKPLKVSKVRRATLKLVLMEGRKREVRLLMQKAGLPVLQLSRVRLGNLALGKLPIGSWRILSAKEREQVFA